MGGTVPPGARNKKAPARFLSGRTSAMIEACVKGGRFVNAFFVCISIVYTKALGTRRCAERSFWRELMRKV